MATAEELALGGRIRALITGALGSAGWESAGGGAATQLDANGTILDVDVINNGEVLKRVGTTIVSAPAGAPGAHAVTHQDGGIDEISVAALSGLLADPQTPAVHTHAGTDIVSGLVAAARLAAHDIVTAHSASGLTIGNVLRAATATTFAFAQLAFADLGATPTTRAGYGITDAAASVHTHVAADITDFNAAGDARWSLLGHTHTFASLTSKPTTLAGYGITDAAALVHTHAAADIVSGQLAVARGGTAVDGSSQAINLVFASPGSGGAGAVAFRALVAADIPVLDTAKITTGTFATARLGGGAASATVHLRGDQTWAAVAFADLSGKPTTIGGYGITDFNSLGDARWALIATTLAGYGITDAYTKTAADARYAPIVHTHAAADVTSGRFVAARMLDGTNGFMLFGRGSGVDPAYASFVSVRLTADNAAIAAAAPTTALQVANLTQAALINEEWDLEWIIEIANSVAADVFVFNVTSTAGTLTGRYTVEGTNGVPNLGAGVVKFWSVPAGTLTTANANAPGATGTIGLVLTVVIRARVKLTVANGTIQLLLRAGTNAAASSGTAVVKSGSQLIANKIA